MSYTLTREQAIVPIIADASLPKGSLVKLNASGKVIANTAGSSPLGCLLEDVEIGYEASVAIAGGVSGSVYMVSNAALSLGDSLTPSANGRVANRSASTQPKCGICLESNVGSGTLFEAVLLSS